MRLIDPITGVTVNVSQQLGEHLLLNGYKASSKPSQPAKQEKKPAAARASKITTKQK